MRFESGIKTDIDNEELKEVERIDKHAIVEQDIIFNIMHAMGASFDAILSIDIDTEIYYMLYKDANGKVQIKKSEDYSQKARYQINKVVHKDFIDEVKVLYMPNDLRNILKEKSDIESTHLRWNGTEYRWVRMNIQVSERIDGNVSKVVYTFKDIHEQKLKELNLNAKLEAALSEAKNAYESKTQFLSNISHDLRTPMKAIMGISTLMRNKDTMDKTTLLEYLERIDLASENMLELINSILDMSKVESTNIGLMEREYSISSLVHDVETIIRVASNEKKQNLIINNMCTKDAVKMDIVKMRQLLINILSNAVKYTDEEGEISLDIDNKGDMFTFVIKDNGIGMSSTFLSNIYEPFERETRVRYTDGIGLGMSIVKRIVDMMNGTIDINTDIGEGTEVRIAVPLECVVSVKEETDCDKIDFSKYEDYKLLVVEDNEINLFILLEVLSEFGCNVDIAMDGLEAIAKVASSKENYYDLIIMDMKMPNMDGDIATKNIRMLNGREDLKNIPIILASADSSIIDKEKLANNGITDYVIKPIDSNKIRVLLDEYLEKNNKI